MEGLGPFYDLRHGQTDWNRQGLYMGSQDIPLNKTGEKEAMHTARFLVPEDARCILTSPLLRAKKTVHLMGWPRRPLPNVLPLLHVPPTTHDHPWQIVDLDNATL